MNLKSLFVRYKSFVLYAFFGVCTTAVNVVSYKILYGGMGINNVPATALAWLFAVLFAFVTNKLFVFASKSLKVSVILYELATFFACRIATGLVDVAIMWLAVDKMHWNAVLWKFLSNILVIILNYVASKFIIFTKKERR